MKLTDLALLSLQTTFMQRDLTTRGLCAGVQEEIRDSATNLYNILMYQVLKTATDTPFANSLVDELAWQFHVDYYDKTAAFNVKKSLVQQSIKIHQRKGTPQAVLDLLNTAFPSDTLLLEWFDYNGEPYHFKIVTSDLSSVDRTAFEKALNSVKNARSYCESIDVFTAVMHYAINNINLSREIEYNPNQVVSVGETFDYEFQNGDVLTFDNDEYSFIE